MKYCQVKVCGVTRPEDAERIIEAGADLLGLIFADASPRRLSREQARSITKTCAGRIQTVGVFQNQPQPQVLETARDLGLDWVQLHGTESVDYCQTLPWPIMKVWPLPSNQGKWPDWPPRVRYLLFDKPKGLDNPDWFESSLRWLEAHPHHPPAFFAGGLTADNVAPVIQRLTLAGVDVASGVESAPGVKDSGKLMAFCKAVRQAAQAKNK
jgi:phosphoribosylanthranilate isomerase